jgi:hypothetical protein
MSKDKNTRNTKKSPSTTAKSSKSDYQTSKLSKSVDPDLPKKKKNT